MRLIDRANWKRIGSNLMWGILRLLPQLIVPSGREGLDSVAEEYLEKQRAHLRAREADWKRQRESAEQLARRGI